MVEGARLESVYTLKAYRGFESLPLRQIEKGAKAPFSIWDCAFEPSMIMDGFDKIAGSDFEQRSVSDAGREAVEYRDVRNNPSLSAN